MKLTKLIGIVLSLHLGVAGMLLFQPGCQTLQMDEKAEINPVQTLVPEKEEERARILIGEKKDDLPVIQGNDEDNFNSDTIRNRRYLPSRPVEPIIPETPSEVEYVSVVEEELRYAKRYNQSFIPLTQLPKKIQAKYLKHFKFMGV